MVSDRGSENADAASENVTECLSIFAAALSGLHSKLITANTQAAAVCFIALTNLCGLLQFVGIYAGFASTQVLADLYSVAAGVA